MVFVTVCWHALVKRSSCTCYTVPHLLALLPLSLLCIAAQHLQLIGPRTLLLSLQQLLCCPLSCSNSLRGFCSHSLRTVRLHIGVFMAKGNAGRMWKTACSRTCLLRAQYNSILTRQPTSAA